MPGLCSPALVSWERYFVRKLSAAKGDHAAGRRTPQVVGLRLGSWRRPGLLVPSGTRQLRARAVVLRAGACMEWHSNGGAEELLVALQGAVQVEVRRGGRCRRRRLGAGQTLFLPMRTPHRVVNASKRIARYVYVRGLR